MSDYSKYLIPFWQKREKEIEESVKFREDGSCDIWDNKYIAHAMISGDGYVSTLMRMLVHISRWQSATGLKIHDMKDFLEIGGGFGGMAKQIGFVNRNPYTIIDLPVMSRIQSWFLRNEPQVDCCSLSVFDQTSFNCDMFISTFALSECSEAMIRKVIDTKFFNAQHMLFIFGRSNFDNYQIEPFIPELKKYKGFGEYDAQSYYIFN